MKDARSTCCLLTISSETTAKVSPMVEVVSGRMKRNILSDFSGTSLSPAQRFLAFPGVKLIPIEVERVQGWRSSEFLRPQLRPNVESHTYNDEFGLVTFG
ncbi:hypothetical protein AVEN_25768-1 [Araneus ventricosus]|uniref:Uncharacterized protein n=1 Tax=Araneus ventricosus TaxID=182803 RepID=A0A4Y2ILP6_ARAVE|nr:hypothetical protein AVEN_25768-1 [Araneus ventricosus]